MNGRPVEVPAKGGRTHLQFRRFAGCPICHLHLCSYAHRHQEVADAGIIEVVLSDSPDDELRGYQSLLPFVVVADPDWVLYRDFGLETGLRAAADPRAWWDAIRGGTAALLHRNNPDCAGVGRTHGRTHLGLPADFLIDHERNHGRRPLRAPCRRPVVGGPTAGCPPPASRNGDVVTPRGLIVSPTKAALLVAPCGYRPADHARTAIPYWPPPSKTRRR